MTLPIAFRWNGKAMVPTPRYAAECERSFNVDELYRLVEYQERSVNSHNHYFISVHEAWRNLPELMTERFPTEEHLRKWCLIKAGYRDERSIVLASHAEALRAAAFIRPFDEYAVVLVSESVVTVYTAKSQSAKAMDKKEFQGSKQAVLDILSGMVGVEKKTLEENAGASA